MAEPEYPKGYTQPLADVYSGHVAGEARGEMPNTTPIAGLFYRHSLNRLGSIVGTNVGFTTVQARESSDPNSKIYFEQSFLLGVQGAGPVWYIVAGFDTKFKTRICDGQFVPPVIESIAPQAEPGLAPLPAPPGLPNIYNVRLTTMSAAMPDLPARATSFDLLWAPAVGGGISDPTDDPMPDPASFQVLQSGLTSSQAVSIDVDSLGISSATNYVAPTEKLWLRLRANGPGGSTLGAAIRDVWTFQQGTALVAGYQGYLFADKQVQPNPSPYYEQGYFLNVSSSGSPLIQADLILPFYGFPTNPIPTNAYFDIISDYWAQATDDNLYFSISWRPGAGFVGDFVHDPALAKTWFLYQGKNDLQIHKTRANQGFALHAGH